MVVTLGNTALRAVTGDEKLVISDVHGRPLERCNLNFEVFPLYHPAAVIYNRSLKSIYMADLDILKAYINS